MKHGSRQGGAEKTVQWHCRTGDINIEKKKKVALRKRPLQLTGAQRSCRSDPKHTRRASLLCGFSRAVAHARHVCNG